MNIQITPAPREEIEELKRLRKGLSRKDFVEVMAEIVGTDIDYKTANYWYKLIIDTLGGK